MKKKSINHLLDRTPPHDIDAEEAVLASVFAIKGAVTELREMLKAEDFYRGGHKKIFTAIMECPADNGIVDIVVLANKLNSKDELESIGGAAYLACLMDAAPMTSNIEHHAKIIIECSIKRLAIIKASKIIELALKNDTKLDIFVAEMDGALAEVKKEAARGAKTEKFEVSYESLFGGDSGIVETPFESLNNMIRGYGLKELTILGGRQGAGKTAFCLGQVRHTMIEREEEVIYCGAHMNADRIYLRLIAQISKTNFRDLLSGRPPKDKIEEVQKAYKTVYEKRALMRHLIIPERINFIELQSNVASAIKKMGGNVKLLIIENLQQLYWPGMNFEKGSFAESNFIIEKIKSWAQDISPSTMISSQLTRKSSEREDKRPKLGDVFSDEAEGLTDIMMLLHRPNYYEKKKINETGWPERDAELTIAKGGPPTILPMTFWGESLSWEERIE